MPASVSRARAKNVNPAALNRRARRGSAAIATGQLDLPESIASDFELRSAAGYGRRQMEENSLNPGRMLAVLAWAMPLFAQYAGPAILSRGEAPSALAQPQIDFRPFRSEERRVGKEC